MKRMVGRFIKDEKCFRESEKRFRILAARFEAFEPIESFHLVARAKGEAWSNVRNRSCRAATNSSSCEAYLCAAKSCLDLSFAFLTITVWRQSNCWAKWMSQTSLWHSRLSRTRLPVGRCRHHTCAKSRLWNPASGHRSDRVAGLRPNTSTGSTAERVCNGSATTAAVRVLGLKHRPVIPSGSGPCRLSGIGRPVGHVPTG